MLKKLKRLISYKVGKFIKNTLNEQNQSKAQNIKLGFQEKSLKETIDYIEKKMLDIQSYPTKENVLEFAAKNTAMHGMILEFGVFSGYTINLISDLFKSQIIYGFDSFQGLPENWRDGFPEGAFGIENLPKVNRDVKLIKGWFDETLPKFTQENNEDVAFLHIDCDLYSSTKIIFEVLKARIKKGTVIVFDEYFNYPGWKNGEFKAFQEFVNDNNLKYRYLTYNNRHEQVALIIE